MLCKYCQYWIKRWIAEYPEILLVKAWNDWANIGEPVTSLEQKCQNFNR